MRLLDADVLIDALRGHAPTVRWLAGLPELPGVPGQVALELLATRTDRRQVRQVQALIADMPVVWPSPEACRRALDEYPTHRLRDGLGPVDALIAACALEQGATLCTFNVKHYRRVAGLDVRAPYSKRAARRPPEA